MAMNDLSKARYRRGQAVKRRIYYKALRILAVKKLGGKCARCGFSDFRALQFDHIHGKGTMEWEEVGAIKIFQFILSDPNSSEKYQILCANCNWIKKSENDEVDRIYPLDNPNSADFLLSDIQASIVDWEKGGGISDRSKDKLPG
jgi:hypothetical protein